MKKIILLIAGVLAFPAVSAAQQLADTLRVDPNVTMGRLPNGLRYYIRVNNKPEKRAELRLAVNVGSVLEDEKQRGLAHVVEHMAFNGTEHFKKQELVHYLESIGMRFGADLNAYTSFDETVYMLTVPTDTGKALEQGVQILEDWAHEQVFDPAEINKERGVVIEEWRLGQGAEERMRDKYFPVLFANSRYAERMPIGTKISLETFSHADLKRFYHDWYRPELMAVVAVGDFDKTRVEEMIKAHFGTWKHDGGPPRAPFPVPDHDTTLVSITADKEATVASVSVYNKLPLHTQVTVADYRLSLAQSLFMQMINDRFEELTQQGNPPFIGASAGGGAVVRTKEAFILGAATKDDGILRGLEAVMTEAARVQKHGFAETELQRAKTNLLRSYEQAYAERDKSESAPLADEYVRAFLESEPIPGITTEYQLAQTLLPQISIQMVNALIKEWISDKNRVVIVQAPEKPTVKIPTQAEISNVIAHVRTMDLKPYDDRVADASLIPNMPTPGTIVTETRDTATSITIWKLSNGARVLLKPTDFQADQVLMRASSPGGTSLVADKDYVSALFSTTLVSLSGLGQFGSIELNKALTGKAARVSPFLAERREGFSGQASPKDLETLFQLTYLHATSPRRDTTAYQSLRSRLAAVLENQSASPESAFQDTLEVTLTQHHFRSRPLTMKLLDEVSLDRALDIYRERFGDASDFTFAFVGNFTVDEIKPLVLRYIGGLPSTNRKENWRDNSVRPPTGVVERVVKRGVEQKANTDLVFTGPATDLSGENRSALSLMLDILEIRLREVLREDLGGTYGVDIGGSMSREPYPSYTISVSFGADPARIDTLTKVVFQQIDLLKAKGVTAEEVAKVKETQKRSWETNVKRNDYWLGQIIARDEGKERFADVLTLPSRIDKITAQQIARTADLLRRDNYVRVTLLPEK
ncbi:MAG TPA: insulinase family protein [Longimicrobiales bacterium]|nr:insulinase family protein [Longimicrobiales bacterium]